MSDPLQASYEKLKICKDIEQLTKSPAWQKILEPWLNAAIVRCIGGRNDKDGFPRWEGGALQKPDDKGDQYYIARKQALMDFHNMVYNHVRAITTWENKIKTLEERAGKEKKHPTMGRSRYARNI